MRTEHDGFHPHRADEMLFDVADDPHEQADLAGVQPDVMEHARASLDGWIDPILARHPPEPHTFA